MKKLENFKWNLTISIKHWKCMTSVYSSFQNLRPYARRKALHWPKLANKKKVSTWSLRRCRSTLATPSASTLLVLPWWTAGTPTRHCHTYTMLLIIISTRLMEIFPCQRTFHTRTINCHLFTIEKICIMNLSNTLMHSWRIMRIMNVGTSGKLWTFTNSSCGIVLSRS